MTHITKLFSILFLASIFSVAALQPASAQTDATDAHNVTITVDNIDELLVTGAPTIAINAGELNTWVEGDNAGNFEVTSNAGSDRKIEISGASQNSGGDLGNFGLRVKADGVPGGGVKAYTDEFTLSGLGESTLNTGNFITAFQKVEGSSHGLIYEGTVNADYNPSKTTVVNVEYTLTGD